MKNRKRAAFITFISAMLLFAVFPTCLSLSGSAASNIIYYEIGSQLYRQEGIVAQGKQLSMPSLLTGGYYDADGSSLPVALNQRPSYQGNRYLIVEFTLSFTDEDRFAFTEWQLRWGDTGSVFIPLHEIVKIENPGSYKAVVDLSKYSLSTGTKWYGSYITMAYGQITISKFQLVTLKAIDSHSVNFLDWTGKTLCTQLVAYGEAANPPIGPIRPGYTFTGWEDNYKKVTGNIDVHPRYQLDDARKSFQITVQNGLLSTGETSSSYRLTDICKVKSLAAAPSGQVYSWLVDTEGSKTIIGYGNTLSFRVTGSMKLQAKLISNELVQPLSYCNNDVQVYSSDDNSQTILFALTFSLPPTCSLVEFGTVSIQALALSDNEELLLNTLGATVFKGKYLSTGGQWYRIMQTNRNPYVALRGYLTYCDANGAQKTVYSNTVRYGKEQEYVNITLRKGDDMGVWWWHPVNLEKPRDRKYLNFLSKNGVTKIYGGFDSTDYEKTAKFIEEANKRGIKVAALGGASNWVTTNIGGLGEYIDACLDYNRWAQNNNRGVLYGVQMDLEPYNATPEIWRQYAIEVEKGYTQTRGTGLAFEMCTNTHLDDINMDGYNKYSVDLSHYTGVWLSEWVACHTDSQVLMSYGDTAPDAHQMSLNELKYEQAHKTAQVISGQETGPEVSHVTYYDDSKKILYREIRNLYQLNVSVCPDVPTGIAFHNVQTWYSLQ